MKEFGSDFHRCENNFIGKSYLATFGEVRLYSSGRHALEAIIKKEKWNRIWIPAYFCYEVIEYISSLGIKVKLYNDNPLMFYNDAFTSLDYSEGDVLLRMNFFGIREISSNKNIPIPVIEDHTHDIISNWALNSDADWCVASVRKSLPIAAGGILWSPKQKELPKQMESSIDCEMMASIRYSAMDLKKNYLFEFGNKEVFREKYIQSEQMIEKMSISGMDNKSINILYSLDIEKWTKIRKSNWNIAIQILSNKFNILKPQAEKNDELNPFSLVLLFDTVEERNNIRQYLINNSIYPAILWNIPNNSQFSEAIDFSQKMLSLHCDARYSENDIKQMCGIITKYND